MRNKFLIILPYFGALPPYFVLWLRSLVYVNIDVLFITDIKLPRAVPVNLKVLKLSLEDVRALAQQKLGTAVVLNHPRKLCDLRPFYGMIFQEYIGDYEYWGFGDCDLVYGKGLNKILCEVVDTGYDIATFRKGRVSGGLTFVRNADRLLRLGTEIDDWKMVLADERNFLLDEIRNWLRFSELGSGRCTLEDIRREDGDSFSAVVWRTKGLKIFSEDILYENRLYFYARVRMDRGQLTYNWSDIAVFHFVGVKSFPYFDMNSSSDIKGDPYVIDSAGFMEAPNEVALVLRESWVMVRWLPSLILIKLKNILRRRYE